MHEVTVHVRMYPPRYRALFAAAGRERVLTVRDDTPAGAAGGVDADADWGRSLRLVREPLTAALGAELVELFRPGFSTTTPDDEASALVALMDVVSPYYDFRWETRCGIPKVRLEGTAEDWALLEARVGELAGWFEPLGPWFAELHRVLAEIAATAAGGPVDEEFWRSLYKWDSESGGDFVSGWITAFFAHTQTLSGPEPRTDFRWRDGRVRFEENAFPSHVSKVPFEWRTPAGTSRTAFVGGVLGIERDGEYVRPRLGNAVLEVVREALDPAAEQAELAAAQLPEGWTIERVREVSGSEWARPVSTDGVRVVDGGGEPLGRAVAVVRFSVFYLLRCADDDDWYAGMLFPDGLAQRELSLGPDLASALARTSQW
ncbi:DUF4419 domain-containing protein [Kitasatospora sp. NPDC059648]|uniref:DUF4419 domain-containing protein n=1 Tax=Kitasatospora sp. NPDC059648 TaxID=3346894 RepID=UPI00368FA002